MLLACLFVPLVQLEVRGLLESGPLVLLGIIAQLELPRAPIVITESGPQRGQLRVPLL